MTKEEYFKLLESHDWYYHYSDDHRVFCAGERQWSKLEAIAENNSLFKKMLNDYCNYMFSGESFGTESKPKPKLEDYQD